MNALIDAICNEDIAYLKEHKDLLWTEIYNDIYPIHLALCTENWALIDIFFTEVPEKFRISVSQCIKPFLPEGNPKLRKLFFQELSPAIRDLFMKRLVNASTSSVPLTIFRDMLHTRLEAYEKQVTKLIPRVDRPSQDECIKTCLSGVEAGLDAFRRERAEGESLKWIIPNWSNAQTSQFMSPEFMQRGFRFTLTISIDNEFVPTFTLDPLMGCFKFTLCLRIVNHSDPVASVTEEKEMDFRESLDPSDEVKFPSPIPLEFTKDDELTVEITLTPSPDNMGRELADLHDWMERLKKEEQEEEEQRSKNEMRDRLWLLAVLERVFLQEPTMLRVKSPCIIVGNLHGQVNELLRILDDNGFPPETTYVFLGNYVDYGNESVPTLLILLICKLLYPDKVLMIRGNHEDESVWNPRKELNVEANDKELFQAFGKVFDAMPLAVLVDEKILCVSSGLSPKLESVVQIEAIHRPLRPKLGTIEHDLLWSDPNPDCHGYAPNTARDGSYFFGLGALNAFCDKNGLDLIVRAHQKMPDGYAYNFGEGKRLVTVYSAPNCQDQGNKGAYMKLANDGSVEFVTYEPVDENFKAPDFESWVEEQTGRIQK